MASGGIIERATRCDKILSHLIETSGTEDQRTWAETQSQRLGVWSETLGVRAQAKYSIEHRLASNQQISTIVKQLLDALHTNLCHYHTALTHEPLPDRLVTSLESANSGDDSDSSDDSSSTASEATEPTLEETTARIDAGLTRLGQLAVRIRREGVKRAAKAALNFVPLDALGQPLEVDFRSCVRASLLRAFPPDQHERKNIRMLVAGDDAQVSASDVQVQQPWPEPRPDTPDRERTEAPMTKSEEPPYLMPDYLRDRFADTMVRRWKRICYNRKHAQELAGHNVKRKPIEEVQRTMPVRLSSDQGLSHSSPKVDGVPVQPQKMPVAKTVMTEHSVLNPDARINMNVDLQQPSKSIITGIKAGNLRYPRPPDAPKGADIFTCPLCKLPLPTQLLNKRQWQLHVMQDLAPYFCVIKRCPSAATTYSTHEEWLSHVRAEHMESSWHCNSCEKKAIFPSPLAFQAHFKSTHIDDTASSPTPFMTKLAEKKKAYIYAECYFCGFVPDGYEDDRSDEAAQELIEEHMVTDHMKAFALDCLPWDYAGDGGNSLYQGSQSRDSDSEHARDDILYDQELTQLLQDTLDADDSRTDYTTVLHQATLKDIRNRWDSSLDVRQGIKIWLSADQRSHIDKAATVQESETHFTLPKRWTTTKDILAMNERPVRQVDLRLYELIQTQDVPGLVRHTMADAFTFDDLDLCSYLPWAGRPLHAAVYTGNVDVVKTLPLRHLGHLLVEDVGSALSLAVRLQNHAIVDVLIAAGHPPAYPEGSHASPVAVACATGDLSLVEKLVHTIYITDDPDLWFDLDAINVCKHNPSGTYPGQLQMRRVDITITKKRPLWAVHGPLLLVAALYGHEHIVRYLALAEGANLNAVGRFVQDHWQLNHATTEQDEGPILGLTAVLDNGSMVACLLDLGADIRMENLAGYNALDVAASTGASEALAVFLLHIEGWHDRLALLDKAIAKACRDEFPDTIQALLDHGALFETLDDLALACGSAYEHGNLVLAGNLLSHSASYARSLKSTDGTLARACHRGNIQLLELLLDNGSHPDDRDREGAPALTIASSAKDVRGYGCVELLLSRGAMAHNPDMDGNTALHYAALGALPECIELLLAHGAILEHGNREGSTALHAAVASGYNEAVAVLLAHGARSDRPQGPDGNTPLIIAAMLGKLEVMNTLLAHGADTEIKNGKGRTAVFYARTSGHIDIIKTLHSRGARLDV